LGLIKILSYTCRYWFKLLCRSILPTRYWNCPSRVNDTFYFMTIT
jgi:hypothetical protein